MQGENICECPPLTRSAVSLEEGPHFFGQPLVLLVEEHTDARLSTPASSAHL